MAQAWMQPTVPVATAEAFVGTVKSFNPLKGWGFVECDTTKQMYGSDVFLLKGELQGNAVSKGDQIQFQVKQGPKGIQATEVKVLQSADGGGQSFYGEIKNFNPQKGYGFITSPATEAIYGKDIFVMKSELPGGMGGPGTPVQYKVKTGERGPVAYEVQIIGGGMGPGAWGGARVGAGPAWGGQWGGGAPAWPAIAGGWGGPGWDGGNAWGKGGGKGGAWGNGVMGVPAQKIPSENEVFFGTLKSVNAEKGWGHISCEAMQKMFGKDMFVMRSDLESSPMTVGQQVAFSVTQGPKGPHAVNLRPYQPTNDRLFTGSVKSFNDTKGWGFIESPQARLTFHTDIFLHKKELNGMTVNAGDQVTFSVDISGGRAAAKTVQVAAYGAARSQVVAPPRHQPY